MARKILLGLIFIGGLVFNRCVDSPPTLPKAAPQTVAIEIDSDIVTDQVWFSWEVRTIRNEISVKGATLQIEPGTKILFDQGASLTIGDSAKIIADGTDEPIIFTGVEETPGFWKYVRFAPGSDSDNSQLNRCHFKYGGGDSLLPAMVICDNSQPVISNCTITDGSSNGVIFLGNCLNASFFNNTIKNCVGFPVQIDAANLAALGTNSYANNGNNVIRIGNGKLSGDVIWYPQEIPYSLSQGLQVERGILTLAPGSVLKFETGKSLSLRNYGGILANGSNEQIEFSSLDDSYWEGIIFEENANASASLLDHCLIEKGGSSQEFSANIIVKAPNLQISNCLIRGSQGSGIYFATDNISGNFAGNTFDANQNGSLSLPATAAEKIGIQFFGENGNNNILLRGGTISGAIQSNTFWKKLPVAYEIFGTINIKNSTLTIEAGTNLILHSDTEFIIENNGGLIADGTGQTIVFSGARQNPGSWGQIYFAPTSSTMNCKLINCQILYGGNNPILPGMVYCDQVAPTIRNCYIAYSATYGLYLNGNATFGDFSTNQFAYNVLGDIFPTP